MENFPSNFVAGFLRLHNEYRAIHGSPPLQIDEQLNEPAQEWAERLARKGVIEYRSDPNYGENIYLSFSRVQPHEIKPREPLESWYREGKYFKYGDEEVKGLEGVRHFTQLVWKKSKLMGLGMAGDGDGKIYFVCLYHPPGNVKGEFADNVSPIAQEDKELLEHEAEGIRRVKSKPDVVRSMERIYAVPSEKLRVWSIWLTKIGEIADEWQRWLRAHIDFVMRLAEQLQAAEETLSQAKEEGDQSSRVASETVEDSGEIPSDAGDFDRETSQARSEISISGKATEASLKSVESAVTVADETEEGGEEGETQIWPIGTPWIHLGIEDADDREPFERLPLPRDEEEMRQFVKKFTHQATIYRSYYKHWRETADQAIKEIACRPIMPTWRVRGMDENGKIKKPPCRKVVSSKYTRPSKGRGKKPCKKSARKPARKRARKPARKSKGKASVEASLRESTESKVESRVASESKIDAEEEEPVESSTENPETASNGATRESSKQEMESKKSASKTSKKSEASARTSNIETIEVDDLVRDCARAAEPLPYIFYVKAEPDIDIAIEHDDQVVIAEDTDRENVVGDYKNLFFNLTDKPCKGGKPWIL